MILEKINNEVYAVTKTKIDIGMVDEEIEMLANEIEMLTIRREELIAEKKDIETLYTKGI